MYHPDYIFHWLARPDIDLPYAFSILIQQLHRGIEASDIPSSLRIIEKLKTNSTTLPRLERAAIRMECALAAWKMDNPSQAGVELQEVVDILASIARPDKRCIHLEALAAWVLGALGTQLLLKDVSVESNWQKSLDLFKSLCTHRESYLSERDRYADRVLEMHQAIGEALTEIPQNPAWPGTAIHCGRLETLEIYHTLPDEGSRIAGRNSQSQGVIPLQPITRQVTIAGGDFWLKSLRSPGELLLLDSLQRYFVFKIAGDGMDRAGLRDGDYVLVRDQRQAESGDIVLVGFIQPPFPAALYNYSRYNDRFVFTAQSSDPNQPTFEYFPQEGDRFTIHGVVLGVFKSSSGTEFASQSERVSEQQTGPDTRSNEAPAPEETPIPISDFLQTFPVYEKIPAGGPNVPPVRTGDYLELDRFFIQDKVYAIKNLRGGRRIRPRCSEVMILKVIGDSMDLAGIDDGDYILLCLQDHASHNDIVAAQISNLDPMALLKRYIEHNDHFVLKPESTNPSHQEREFEKRILTADVAERKVHIRGVAVAVFKPA